ncbi:MAG TPA: 16S rRNA (guanine(527)-N(7))-methyltransferase RsmG [Anaerolineales bacterium]|nr:16S rRNA (guanine(527)-N(7))-methyltransferase RsmG [Anaerolineales bacterium]HRQ92298.1 16S rRNA (guanine(527)-N(7))-methyltransferase RsmG [Anaerolineales bacterium]
MTSFTDSVQAILGEPLSAEQAAAFDTYADELLDWNQRINLTAVREREAVHTRHFLDSLSCWLAMRQQPGARIIDIGTGAGLPGLPLKIWQPRLQLSLLESVGKKARFLEHVVQVLGLDNVQVLTARAEDAGRDPAHREQYDWAVARAVAPLPVLAEYLLPFVRVGGYMLAQKARGVAEEAEQAANAFGQLGGKLRDLIQVRVPGLEDEERWLVVVQKLKPTQARFPRQAGTPSKNPL